MSTIEKYIENPDFCAWSLGDDSFNAYWETYLKEHPEEQALILQAKAFVQKVQLDESKIPPLQQEKLWTKISQSIADSAPKQKQVRFQPWLKYAAAICIFIAAGLFLWQAQNNSVVYVAEAGQSMKQVDLPDGSAIDMNAESSIAFDADTWEESRKVTLEGEAFFKVKKGETFEVITDKGTVTVLGTSFNVLARTDQWSVTCYTGKVKVMTEGYQDVVLTAGESVSLIDEQLQEKHLEKAESKPLWQVGIFRYEKTQLSTVFKEVERQFNVKVSFSQEIDQTIPFTGTFNNKELSLALDIICKPLGYQYQIKGQTVTIFND